MILAANIEPNALIILVIMIIGGLKWLIERVKGVQPQDPDEVDSTTPFQDLYEEARREILQRQGNARPPEETRSSIFQPPTAPPPLPPSHPPAAPTARPVASPYSQRANVPRPVVLSAAQKEAARRMEAHGISGHRPGRGRRRERTGVRRILSSPSAARDAIVLREILGPPKGAARRSEAPSESFP